MDGTGYCMEGMMGTALRALGGFGMLALAATTVAAQEKGYDQRRTISVTGQAEVNAAPDLALLSVAVETTSARAEDAAKDNAQRSAKISAALKALIGSGDKLTTTRYSLEPRYEPGKGGGDEPPRIIGYVARNEVQVDLHAIDAVGRLIDAAIAAGANRVSNLQFTLSNHNAQLRAALQKAGEEARAQAETVAAALGVTLRRVATATTSIPPVFQPRRLEGYGMTAMAAAPSPIEPGEVSVSATLQVSYEIE